jgi:hypothetical protein
MLMKNTVRAATRSGEMGFVAQARGQGQLAPTKMLKVGSTGSIAVGKSFVLDTLRNLGARTI